jgi:hypothetical protein
LLHGDSARGFLQYIDFANPFHVDGVVGALVTGHLKITFKDEAGKEVIKAFLIYNNRLLISMDDQRTHYSCSEGFAQALLSGIM